MATAIPREINLGLQKPVATPAFTRRFKSQSNTTTTAAGSQVTITLDTAQPGSFIDCLSSYLSFTVNFINTSTTQGFNASFSAAGAHALIRALRIYVQGVPIEEITEYNALVEFLMDLSGAPDFNDKSSKSRFLANTMWSDQSIYLPPASGSNTTVRSMNIQLPLVSGVLGTMAEKMFPSMLVAPGNCYIQLDLATAANAFKIQNVDVSSLLVSDGIATVDGASDSLPTFTSEAASKSGVVATNSASQAGGVYYPNGFIATAGRASKLDTDNIYDTVAFATTTPSVNAVQSVYSTEERLGGGSFGLVSTNGIADTVVGTTAVAYGDASSLNAPIRLGTGIAQTGNGQAGAYNTNKMDNPTQLVSFSLTGVEFIGKQVVVGDDVARAIIERSAAGDISIHTQSYRQYPQTISTSNWTYQENPIFSPGGASLGLPTTVGSPLVNGLQRFCVVGAQSIIIPAKISSANAIYNIFRNGSGLEDFRFDSMRRMTIGMTDNNTSACTVQMRIGNELIPQSPIQSASEALQELLKAHHMEGYMGTTEKMGSVVANSQCFVWPNTQGFYSLTNARSAGLYGVESIVQPSAPFSNPTYFTSQGALGYTLNDYNSNILYSNPDNVTFTYPTFARYSINATDDTLTAVSGQLPGSDFTEALSASAASIFYSCTSYGSQAYTLITGQSAATGSTAESGWDYMTRQSKFKEAVRRAFFGGRYSAGRGGVKSQDLRDPSSAHFVNPYKQHAGKYSTFALGFDLDTFSHNTDTIRSGHYLGNNTVSLNISNIVVEDNSPLNMPLMNSLRMDSYILHDLRLSFQAGGIVQAFY